MSDNKQNTENIIVIDEALANEMLAVLGKLPYNEVGNIMAKVQNGGIKVMKNPALSKPPAKMAKVEDIKTEELANEAEVMPDKEAK